MSLSGVRVFGSGAPAITYESITKSQPGKVDIAMLSYRKKIKNQYAVINTSEVLTSLK